MKKEGIKLVATAPAKLKGNDLILPVTGGKEDPTTGKGEVEPRRHVVFAKGKRKVPLRSIELKAKKTPLFAKVGGSQLKVATTKKLISTRKASAQGFKAQSLLLTQKVATRLNKKLRTGRLFGEGMSLGSLKSTTTPQRVAILPQGQATLTPDPAFLAKLKALFVSFNPISPAELHPVRS